MACQIRQADGAANLLFLVTCERYLEVPAVNGITQYADESSLQALYAREAIPHLFPTPQEFARFAGVSARSSRTGRSPSRCHLFDFDLCARRFDFLLDIFGLLLGDTFLDRLWSAFDQRFCLSQPKTGNRGADFLDHRDLVGANLLQDSYKAIS